MSPIRYPAAATARCRYATDAHAGVRERTEIFPARDQRRSEAGFDLIAPRNAEGSAQLAQEAIVAGRTRASCSAAAICFHQYRLPPSANGVAMKNVAGTPSSWRIGSHANRRTDPSKRFDVTTDCAGVASTVSGSYGSSCLGSPMR